MYGKYGGWGFGGPEQSGTYFRVLRSVALHPQMSFQMGAPRTYTGLLL